MRNVNLTLVKKNRKYFACISKGYDVKLVIDTQSEGLALGEHELLVEDVSVRTKFGTDVIYQLAAEIKKTDKIVTLQHPVYNAWLVDTAKNLGGKWDAGAKAWVFATLVGGEVEALDVLYNDSLVTVDIKATDKLFADTGPVTFLGYTIARAFGRDGGAKLGDSVALIEGSIGSGGSAKNWITTIAKDSVVRLVVSENLLKENSDSEWEILSTKPVIG